MGWLLAALLLSALIIDVRFLLVAMLIGAAALTLAYPLGFLALLAAWGIWTLVEWVGFKAEQREKKAYARRRHELGYSA